MSFLVGIAVGSFGTACLFVFWPDLAVIPAGVLRKAWTKFNEWRKGP